MRQHVILGTHQGRSVALDLQALLRGRLLIQGGSGSGKSWLLRRLAEQLFGKIPVIIIDPEGEFATLRERYGYVLVGKGGETPADVRSAGLVALQLLELHASAVCDIFELKPHERHRWVKAFLDALIDAPKRLWQPVVIIVDESHLFAPEKGAGESEASDSMISLTTRGRKRGYAAVFATQRLGKLRKDAAAELQNILVGHTFIDIDRKRAADELGVPSGTKDRAAFFDEVKLLSFGQFYGLGRAITMDRTLIAVGGVTTTHPKPGFTKRVALEPPPPPNKVKALLPKLADLPKEAEEKAANEATLRRRVRELEHELRDTKRTQPAAPVPQIERKRVEVSVLKPGDLRRLTVATDKLAKAGMQFLEVGKLVSGSSLQIVEALKHVRNGQERPSAVAVPTLARVVSQSRPRAGPPSEDQAWVDGPLPPGEHATLTAAIQYPDGLIKKRLGVLTGYKRSSRDAYVARLVKKRYIEVRGQALYPTHRGTVALGDDVERLPTGYALVEYWRGRLPEGERKTLEVLIAEDRAVDIERVVIDNVTGYKRSSRDAYLTRLKARGLVDFSGPGLVRARRALFA